MKSTKSPMDLLKDLLAIIHRDGGHHTASVGLEDSTQDAILIISHLRRDFDHMEFLLKSVEAELQAAVVALRPLVQETQQPSHCCPEHSGK